MTRALALTTLALGLAIAGCGGDDSGKTTAPPAVSIPSITSPIPATTTIPVTTSTSTGTTGNGNGGSGPPKRTNPNLPDSATNDVAPPAGSPQEAFEKQCEQNPKACG
ncbi:MAG TPA: hypothetical protein VI028_01530 [Solirubrobacterales bacterium]